MIRTSQALLYGAIAVCLTAVLAFTGGWKLAQSMAAMSVSELIEAPTADEDANEPQSPAAIRQKFLIYWDVWELVHEEFYHKEPLDQQQMVYGSIQGMLQSLNDQYTGFQEPRDAERTRESLKGSFEGIGALLNMQDGQLIIVRPLRKSPAIKAGIEPGDIIVEVDGEPVVDMVESLNDEEALDEVVKRIRGPEGSTVVLTIRRESEDGEEDIFDVEIERDQVPLISVNAELFEDNIGYLQITDFKDSTPGEFDEELSNLLEEDLEGLMLDLRNNPGGILPSSLEILGRFYDGVALYEENSHGEVKELQTITDSNAPRVPDDLPLVVLINERSASAAEIVAGALHDQRENTTILGQRSFGKGSVQNVHQLRDGSSARITVAHWFTPEKKEIHDQGVAPDHVISESQEEKYAMPCIGDMIPPEGEEACNDGQLWWAVNYLVEGETPPEPTTTPTE
jgi:carboxyl-terminal processing protease